MEARHVPAGIPYPKDRVHGFVHLSSGTKHWIIGATTTPAGRLSKRHNQRRLLRLFYRVCKHHHVHPKKMREWWHYG
jgi:site-specific recombinase XerC